MKCNHANGLNHQMQAPNANTKRKHQMQAINANTKRKHQMQPLNANTNGGDASRGGAIGGGGCVFVWFFL